MIVVDLFADDHHLSRLMGTKLAAEKFMLNELIGNLSDMPGIVILQVIQAAFFIYSKIHTIVRQWEILMLLGITTNIYKYTTLNPINLWWCSDTIWCHTNLATLFLSMACCLFSAMSLPKLMASYQLDPYSTNLNDIWIKIQKQIVEENAFENQFCKM